MSLAQVTELAQFGRDQMRRSPIEAQMETDLLAAAGKPQIGDVLKNLDTASSDAGRTLDASIGTYQRQMRGMGRTLDSGEQAAANRRIGLTRALSSVDARNRAVGNLRQRTDIARSSAMDLRGVIEDSILGARGSAAEMEARRESQYQGELAQYKQQKAAGLGAIAGIAANFIPFVGPFVSGAIGNKVTQMASR